MAKAVILDGAMGTALWARAEKAVPVWRYNIENPEIVLETHREYVSAGADMILSNTFGANSPSLKGYEKSVSDVCSEGVRIAKAAADGKAKVALSVGPLSTLLEPFGDLTEAEAEEIYSEQIGGGMKEKPDAIMLETFMDIEMLKIAAGVCARYDVPLFCSMTFEPVGKTMMGNSVRDMVEGLSDFGVHALGLNCSQGYETALHVIKQFREFTDKPLIFKPNAGKPKISSMSDILEPGTDGFASGALEAHAHGAMYIGGCCGTNPEFIKKIKEKLK